MTQTANTPVQLTPAAPPPSAAAVPAAIPAVTVVAKGRYPTAAEWLHSLGDVPPERIVMTPWPGTATEQDLLVFAERDKRLCELIDGTLVEKPLGRFESLVAMYLVTALGGFVRPRKLGFVLGPDGMNRMAAGNVRMPDVTFFSVDDLPGGVFPRTRLSILKFSIAAEVLSESNTETEMRQKLKEYFESGARLVWIIDPRAETIGVYDAVSTQPARVLTSTDVLDGGTVLPGFQINVADLFVTSL